MASPLRRLPLLITALIVSGGALAGPAAADRPYTSRYEATERGDVTIAGNTLLSCTTSAANCSGARAATSPYLDNNSFAMSYVDFDSDATTFNSSGATLDLPLGATVLWAGLYWGGDTSAGLAGTAAPAPEAYASVRFATPAAGAITVSASQVDVDAARATRFQGFADVTARVRDGGSGTYSVANLQAGTGLGRYGGWGLIVAYRDASQSVRRLNVYDGLRSLASGGVDIAVPGLQTPATGPVRAKVGHVTYDGDRGLAADKVELNASPLSDAANPAGNPLNSSIARGGLGTMAKSPNYVNQLGFDADVIAADGVLANDATAAALRFETGIDVVLPGAVSLVTDQAALAPASAEAPGMSGTFRDGATLTADPGSWTGTAPIAYAYQWLRCDAAGEGCTPIAGATQATYGLTSADVDSTVRVAVRASNVVGPATARSPQTPAIQALAPSGDGAPALSGTARDGQTLAATAGTWTGTPPLSFSYQWRRCDATGDSCVDIPSATASAYTLTSADVAGTVRVRVTAVNRAGTSSAESAPSAPVTAAPPGNVAAPTLSGVARDGMTVTVVDDGGWTGTIPLTFSRQWQRCNAAGAACQDVAGQTATTYQLTSADVAATVRVVVTAGNLVGTASAPSAPSAVVAPAPPQVTAAPSIAGVAQDNRTLTADRGTWIGTPPLSFALQWLRCDGASGACAEVANATDGEYILGTDDVGAAIRLRVTATNSAASVSILSAPTPAVVPLPPSNTSPPTLSGMAVDGATLTATRGAWSGLGTIEYAHRWERCSATGSDCVEIPGAEGASYVLTPADAGLTVRAAVIASNAGGSGRAVSAGSEQVAALPPRNTAPPTITGQTIEGERLTVDPGQWGGTPPLSYSFAWQRCDAAGDGCVPITGADGEEYALVAADVGSRVRVLVAAANSAGAVAATSAPSATVAARLGVVAPPGDDPEQPAPSPPPAPAPADPDDLFTLPGSLVAPQRCQRLRLGGASRRVSLSGVGVVTVRATAAGDVSSDSPLHLSVEAPRGRLSSVAYALDGRSLAQPSGRNFALTVSPGSLRSPGSHVLSATVRPIRRLAPRAPIAPILVVFRTERCSAVFRASASDSGSRLALSLRVHSIGSISNARFTVSSRLLPSSRARGYAGRMRLVRAGGKRLSYSLTVRRGVLLQRRGGPSVRLVRGGLSVTGLPARTGIVELTLFRPRRGSAPVTRRLRLSARVDRRGRRGEQQRLGAGLSRSR